MNAGSAAGQLWGRGVGRGGGGGQSLPVPTATQLIHVGALLLPGK